LISSERHINIETNTNLISSNNSNIWELILDDSYKIVDLSHSFIKSFDLDNYSISEIEDKLKNNFLKSFLNALSDRKEIFKAKLLNGNQFYKFFLNEISHENRIFYRILSYKQSEINIYKSIFESFYDVYYRTNLTGEILLVSPSVFERAGYNPEELIGSNVINFYRKIKDHKELLRMLKEYDEINNFETEFMKADGSICSVALYAHYVKDDDGNKIGIEGVLRDITEQKKNEESIKRYIQELYETKDTMEQNAFELVKLNLQLEDSENKLQELNANKDKFFSIISHDLRNPFSSMLGYAEMLYVEFEEMSKGELKEGIEIILKSAKSAYELLTGLLEWSRVQSGRIEFKPENFSVNNLIDELIALNNLITTKKKITVTNKIYDNINVFADKQMISTTIRNLLGNALKFTPRNGSINITAEIINDAAIICIEDSGVGIKPNDLEKLFRIDIHYTTNGTSHEKGTGLGLILCKDLIEKNNGKIWVESEFGKGSKFFISIPLYIDAGVS
jgi:PAS domain S-box-containing protein